MRWVILPLVVAAASAGAQDSSFTVLRARASVLRLPVVGRIADDWRPKTGVQLDAASNLGWTEIALSVGRVGFDAISGRPPFTETLISLSATRPILDLRPFGIFIGVRLTDVRMDFEDPSLVGGLRNEEEQLVSAIGRARLRVTEKLSAFVEGGYGVLLTSTRTPTATLAIGMQRGGAMPRWLRDFLQ